MNRHVLAAARSVAVVCGIAVLVVVRDPVAVGIAAGVLLAVVVDLVRSAPTRRQQLDDGIVAWLASQPSGADGLQVCRAVGRGTGTIHLVLARLERDGRITSEWADGPYPRRRIYRAQPAGTWQCTVDGCPCQHPIEADVVDLRRRPRRDVRRG